MVRLSEGVRFFAAVFSCSNLDGFKRRNFGCQSFGISGGGKKALSDEEASSLASSSNPAMTSSLVLTSVVLHRDPCFFRSFWSWNFVQAFNLAIRKNHTYLFYQRKRQEINSMDSIEYIYFKDTHPRYHQVQHFLRNSFRKFLPKLQIISYIQKERSS